ncbi:hypothetical protein BDZ45DRAFT_803912 [Acephala macrosclerotiorum]|nr:hypothetical protein BDZ45DRAFT_803912 [Acephala macrosclerotiorum]
MATPKLRGYRKLAALMGASRELAIFRRFDSLNMLKIMSLQAELIELEDHYKQACNEDDDRSAHHDRQWYTRSFKALLDDTTPSRQRENFLKIRKKLTEYNEALLQVALLEKLPPPSPFSLDGLRAWLTNELQDDFPVARECFTWDKDYDDDFVLVANVRKSVPFHKFFEKRILKPLFRCMGDQKKVFTVIDVDAGLGKFNESTLVKVTKTIGTIFATLLPIAAMIVLYTANTVTKRFGLMTLFTAIFSTVLIFFTSATLTEVFGATAAFAAVEVVFIGSTLNH